MFSFSLNLFFILLTRAPRVGAFYAQRISHQKSFHLSNSWCMPISYINLRMYVLIGKIGICISWHNAYTADFRLSGKRQKLDLAQNLKVLKYTATIKLSFADTFIIVIWTISRSYNLSRNALVSSRRRDMKFACRYLLTKCWCTRTVLHLNTYKQKERLNFAFSVQYTILNDVFSFKFSISQHISNH